MIYFILNTETRAIKIGLARDPRARMRSLQTANHGELKLLLEFPGFRKDEAELHEQFAAKRIRGEWFVFDRELEHFVFNVAFNIAEYERVTECHLYEHYNATILQEPLAF